MKLNRSSRTMNCNQRSRIRRPRAYGFTLIELLLVLTILGILAAIVVPKIAGRSEDARKQATVTQISAFKTALNTFEVDNGYYPKGQTGLGDLINSNDILIATRYPDKTTGEAAQRMSSANSRSSKAPSGSTAVRRASRKGCSSSSSRGRGGKERTGRFRWR